MARLAILISGRGTNMEAISSKIKEGALPAEITFVASDNGQAYGLKTAALAGLRTEILPYKESGRQVAELQLENLIKATNTEWIILAGFMRILSPEFVTKYQDRILNIHPSLLPSFPGSTGIKDAWEYGVRITGVTVHLVDEKMDHGVILAQAPVIVNEKDALEDLERKIHSVEHDIYWKTIRRVISCTSMEKRGRRVLID
jgi:phosphoribosylglycinamide formyltransferase-1